MKWAHKLEGLRATTLPSNFFFVDTETWREVVGKREHHYLHIGCACSLQYRNKPRKHTEKWQTFIDQEQFWKWLDSRTYENNKYYLYAHNIHFDWNVLGGSIWLPKLGWKEKSWYVNSGTFIMKFKKGNKKLVVLDSGNIVKAPLANLGLVMGIPKIDCNPFTAGEDELEYYCNRDVEILRDWILRWREFVKKHDLGSYRPTVASQAFAGFIKNWCPHDIFIHDNMKVYELERRSYHGGRVEAFHTGQLPEADYDLLDVNSMYPWVMDKYDYPHKLKNQGRSLTIQKLKDYLNDYAVIADCYVELREPAIGFVDDRLKFPIGRFNTTLTTNELEYVLERGKILKVGQWAIYETAPLFKEYVNYWYPLKNKYKDLGDDVSYMLVKLFLNGLYGKFGQKSESFEAIGEAESGIFEVTEEVHLPTKTMREVYIHGGEKWIKKQASESFNSFPAIASHVTGNARMELWKYVEQAGKHNVFYMDTDSLLVNQEGSNRLARECHRTNLGCLDLEFKCRNAVIYGPKDYIFGDKVRHKGVSKRAKEVKPNTFQQPIFLKFRSHIREGVSDHALVDNVEKHLKREYLKGVVMADGSVKPFLLLHDESLASS